MKTWASLASGQHWALQLDGLITRAATTSGTMFSISNAVDFEFYSSTSAGGIQGNGYQCRNAGPRLVRITSSTSFSIHDIILVDCSWSAILDAFTHLTRLSSAPEFHLTVDGGQRGELYNIAIR